MKSGISGQCPPQTNDPFLFPHAQIGQFLVFQEAILSTKPCWRKQVLTSLERKRDIAERNISPISNLLHPAPCDQSIPKLRWTRDRSRHPSTARTGRRDPGLGPERRQVVLVGHGPGARASRNAGCFPHPPKRLRGRRRLRSQGSSVRLQDVPGGFV